MGIIETIGGKVADGVTEAMLNVLFQYVKEEYEQGKERRALDEACEGIGDENLEEDLKGIADIFLKELKDDNFYTQNELREKFDKYYNEYVLCGISKNIEDDTREELWKRFSLFVPKWLEKYNKGISIGEKRLLEKARETQEMIQELAKNGADKELLREIAKGQSELLNRLCEDINIPFIDISKSSGVKISDYDSKYVFYGNTFDFDETEERIYWECEQVYTLRLLIKNIGRTNIEKISIENLEVEYVKEEEDDNPEIGYFILPMVAHHKKKETSINILPNGEEYLYFMFTDRTEELVDEEQADFFLDDYQYDRLFVMFDLWLRGKEDKGYKYFLFLSKREEPTEYSINGLYDIDYSGFTILES